MRERAAADVHNLAPQVQRWSNATRRPGRRGDTNVFRTPLSCDGGDRVASSFHLDLAGKPETASAVIVRASKMRPRSYDENSGVIGVP